MKKKMPQLDNIYLGNCLQILKNWPDDFIDTCLTSPPYWALRDFGSAAETIWGGDENCKHSFNAKKKTSDFCLKCGAWRGQLGLESTFDLFLKHLCNIFSEIKRVLKPGGTCWVNMGDTFGGSMQGYGASKDGKTGFQKAPKNAGYYASTNTKPPMANIMQKCLLQIPNRFAIEMCKRGWILRNEIIWHKPNCMPSPAKDRFTVDFEKIFLFTKEKKYYFETQHEPYAVNSDIEYRKALRMGKQYKVKGPYKKNTPFTGSKAVEVSSQGRNKRCVWRITTKPFPEAHFAVYPEELCITPIKAGCPEFICKKCGKPRKKIYETVRKYKEYKHPGGEKQFKTYTTHPKRWTTKTTFKKYSDCGCNAGWNKGIVFDPFMGSGTTALVAKKLGRSFIGTEANPEYLEIAKKRLNKNLKRKE